MLLEAARRIASGRVTVMAREDAVTGDALEEGRLEGMNMKKRLEGMIMKKGGLKKGR